MFFHIAIGWIQKSPPKLAHMGLSTGCLIALATASAELAIMLKNTQAETKVFLKTILELISHHFYHILLEANQ